MIAQPIATYKNWLARGTIVRLVVSLTSRMMNNAASQLAVETLGCVLGVQRSRTVVMKNGAGCIRWRTLPELQEPALRNETTALVSGPDRYLPLVQKDMVRRRGHLVRASERNGGFVLEAETPLVELIGYSGWIGELMEGDSPHVSAWLSRYLPIDDGGPRAA